MKKASGKKAFVLAGGGSRGAYQIGAWQALREIGYDFSIVTGTSVGALNGAMIVQGDFEKAKWLWENITLEQVLDIVLPKDFKKLDEKEQIQVLLKTAIKSGGAGFESLKKLLTKCLDEQAVRSSKIELGIVTVKIPGYTPCTLFRSEIPKGQLIDYLLASSACFPAMKSYSIEGNSYIDGGYFDNLPIEMAQKHGSSEVFAVDMDSIGLRRRYDKKKSKVHVLHPREDLGFFLKFDPQLSKRNIRYGYYDTMKYFGKLDGIRYTFRKGEVTKNYQVLRPIAAQLSKKLGIYLDGKPQNPLEKIARFSALKTLRKHQKGTLNDRDVFVCALEFCAQIFSLDSNKLYRMDEMHSQIKTSFEAAYRIFDHKLEQIFYASKENKNAADIIRKQVSNIDQKTLICLSYSLLKEVVSNRKNQMLFWLALCCIPTECLCALYLWLIFGQNS